MIPKENLKLKEQMVLLAVKGLFGLAGVTVVLVADQGCTVKGEKLIPTFFCLFFLSCVLII